MIWKTFLFLLIPIFSIGQNVNISLTSELAIENAILIIDNTKLNKKVKKQTFEKKGSKYIASFQIDSADIVKIKVLNTVVPVYVEPEFDLQFTLGEDSTFFGPITQLDGKGSLENKMYYQLRHDFAHYYDPSIFKESIANSNIDEFEIKLYNQKEAQKKLLKDNVDYYKMSKKFRDLINDKIRYQYLSNILSYPLLKSNKYGINPVPNVMLEAIDQIAIQNTSAYIDASYRMFIQNYVDYYGLKKHSFSDELDANELMLTKFYIAREELKNQPLLYVWSKLLINEFDGITPSLTGNLYRQVEYEENATEYATIVIDDIEEWMNTVIVEEKEEKKSPKPKESAYDLGLVDESGNEVLLEEFRGKVVYIDFWASWCGPCRQQMPYSKKLHQQFDKKQHKELVFLYISIDNTEAAWKGAMKKLDVEGNHVYSPGGWKSKAAQTFRLSGIPRYMLVDKDGVIVKPNAPRPSAEGIYEMIMNLLND